MQQPRFSTPIWNVHVRVEGDLPCTRNHVEQWLRDYVPMSVRTIHNKYLEARATPQWVTIMQPKEQRSATCTTTERTKTSAETIETLVQPYDQRTITDFCGACPTTTPYITCDGSILEVLLLAACIHHSIQVILNSISVRFQYSLEQPYTQCTLTSYFPGMLHNGQLTKGTNRHGEKSNGHGHVRILTFIVPYSDLQ